MKNANVKIGTVLLKKLPYTRKQGLDAFGEFTVVGENGRSWLVTQYPTRGLEKAFKVAKKKLEAKGFFRSWDDVKNVVNPKPAPSTMERISKLSDVEKLRRIEAILNETVHSVIPQETITPRKRAARLRKRGEGGKFVPTKEAKSLH